MANEELKKILPEEFLFSRVESAIKIHASPEGALGETWVFKYGARWVGLYRASMLENFTSLELATDDPGDVVRSGYGAKLKLYGKDGRDVEIDVSALDQDRVEAFFGVEEELDSIKEAEERLSAAPGSIATIEVPDEAPVPLVSPPEVSEEEEEPEAVAAVSEKRRAPATPADLDDHELDERLIEMLHDGRDVAAIKFYREARGGTLSEGRDYIDDLKYLLEDEEDLAEPSEERSQETARELAELDIDPLLLGEIIGYLKMGHQDAAARRLRDGAGLGMVEATEAVQGIAQSQGIALSSGSGYWWRLFWILIIAAGAIAYLRFLR